MRPAAAGAKGGNRRSVSFLPWPLQSRISLTLQPAALQFWELPGGWRGDALKVECFSDSMVVILLWTNKSNHLRGVLKNKTKHKNQPCQSINEFSDSNYVIWTKNNGPGICVTSFLFLMVLTWFWLAIPILMPKE